MAIGRNQRFASANEMRKALNEASRNSYPLRTRPPEERMASLGELPNFFNGRHLQNSTVIDDSSTTLPSPLAKTAKAVGSSRQETRLSWKPWAIGGVGAITILLIISFIAVLFYYVLNTAPNQPYNSSSPAKAITSSPTPSDKPTQFNAPSELKPIEIEPTPSKPGRNTNFNSQKDADDAAARRRRALDALDQ